MRDVPISRLRLDGLSRKPIQSKPRKVVCRTDGSAGIGGRLRARRPAQRAYSAASILPSSHCMPARCCWSWLHR